jgi:hypothetical protein
MLFVAIADSMFARTDDVMSSQPTESIGYAGLEFVLSGIAQWITKYRQARRVHDPLRYCDADQVAGIAWDLGVSAGELANLARKGPKSAALLQKMLLALGVDQATLASEDPLIMRDLQRLCIACAHKKQCEHDLSAGTAAENYRDYCPNTYTLNVLLGTE